ncbi:MAG: hypothetical protein ACOCZK_05275 [Planctomycetota bacterium]
MDETRPLNGLPSDAGAYRLLRESAASSNDLEDHGGDGGAGGALVPRRRRRNPDGGEPRRPDSARPSESDPDTDTTPALVQALDRLRTTHEGSQVDTDRIQALRGVRHYAEAPETRGFKRDPTTAHIARTQEEAQRRCDDAAQPEAAPGLDEDEDEDEDEDPFAGI